MLFRKQKKGMNEMEQVTLGQISIILTFIVGLISAVSYLNQNTKKWLKMNLNEEFSNINNKIDDMDNRIQQIDLQTCKNFLVARISEVEKGIPLNEVERERFFEQYQHYKDVGGNSYIKIKVEELQAKNLI